MKAHYLAIALSMAACGRRTDSSSTPPPASQMPQPTAQAGGGEAVAKAKEVFGQRCVPCHGSSGIGDGPASATLQPKPRAFSDKAWQAQVSDDHIMKIVRYGGSAVGKAPTMPGNPDLSDPAVLAEIKNIVRDFGKK